MGVHTVRSLVYRIFEQSVQMVIVQIGIFFKKIESFVSQY